MQSWPRPKMASPISKMDTRCSFVKTGWGCLNYNSLWSHGQVEKWVKCDERPYAGINNTCIIKMMKILDGGFGILRRKRWWRKCRGGLGWSLKCSKGKEGADSLSLLIRVGCFEDKTSCIFKPSERALGFCRERNSSCRMPTQNFSSSPQSGSRRHRNKHRRSVIY